MTRFASLSGGRSQLRLPLSPVRAEMALKALEEWRQPVDDARERGWYKIANAAGDDTPTQINIYDEISWWGISAEQFCDELAQIQGPVEVHINSPGGDAFDGITIYNALAARPDVTTVVDGLAASAASVIFMAGQTRVASPGGMVMIHDALALCIGNAADMRDTAGLLDKISDNIAAVYAAHTGTPADAWRATMVEEGWYTAAEAVQAGLAHKLADRPGSGAQPGTEPEPDADLDEDPDAAAGARFDRSVFATWQGRPAAAAAGHEAMTGTHTHAHAAYGTQGGDAQHEHEHTHDGDADHGHDHGTANRAAPGVLNGPLPVHHTATVDEPWDGPAAVAAMPNDDTVLRYCHAWQSAEAAATPHRQGDDDADDQKGNYKFPHHKTDGGPANLNACNNGLSRLSGADIPDADRAGVEAHLRAHLDDADDSDEGDGGADDRAHHDISGRDGLEQIRAALKGARS